MKFNARTLLIVASALTLFLVASGDRLPMLFVLLSSELGAILCGVGIWLLYREYTSHGYSLFRLVAGIAFALLAIRFFSAGLVILKAGFTG